MSVRVVSLVSAAALSLSLCVAPAANAQTAESAAQYGLEMIGAEAAFASGLIGANVPVAVFDGGLQLDHPEFAGRIGFSYDIFTGAPLTGDTDGHGTHVAGIIAAARDGRGMMGVAPGALILPVLNMAVAGTSLADTERLMPRGYRLALGAGARIFNNSWGSDNLTIVDVTRAQSDGFLPQFVGVMRETVDAGAVQVWATGNDGKAQPSIEPGLPYLYPELRPGWLAVTAVGRNGLITAYANRCGVAMDWCLAAPGGGDDQPRDGIFSTIPSSTYTRFSGTSMAAPHVSGALAIAQGMYPNAGAQQLAQLLLQTARDIGAPGIDPIYGWGLLSVSNLVATRDAAAGASFSALSAHRFGSVSQVTAAIGRQIGTGPGEPAPLGGQSPASAYASLDSGANSAAVGLAADASVDGAVWVRAIHGRAWIDGGAGSPRSTADLTGVLSGVELAVAPNARVGIGVGATSSETDVGRGGDSAAGDARHLFAYGAISTGALFADVVGQMAGFEDTLTRRRIPGAGTTQVPVGRTAVSGLALDGRARAGFRFGTGFAEVSPYLHASGSWQRTDAAVETGAGALSLTLAAQEFSRLAVGPGLQMAFAPLALSETLSLATELDVAYARRSGDLAPAIAVDMLGTRLVSRTGGVGADALDVGVRLRLDGTTTRLNGEFAYAGSFDLRSESHTLTVGAGLRF